MIFFRPGDIVKFRPIDRAEYDTIPKRWSGTVHLPPHPSSSRSRALDGLAGYPARSWRRSMAIEVSKPGLPHPCRTGTARLLPRGHPPVGGDGPAVLPVRQSAPGQRRDDRALECALHRAGAHVQRGHPVAVTGARIQANGDGEQQLDTARRRAGRRRWASAAAGTRYYVAVRAGSTSRRCSGAVPPTRSAPRRPARTDAPGRRHARRRAPRPAGMALGHVLESWSLSPRSRGGPGDARALRPPGDEEGLARFLSDPGR